MQKLFIATACITSLTLTGCSWWSKEPAPPEPEVRSSVLERLPGVYKMDVQQGNLVTQETVNQLSPGLSKRQVRFIMGTPMLTDVFHPDRWDYVYTARKGHGDMTLKRVTLHFQGDSLARVEGDLRPGGPIEDPRDERDAVHEVPDYAGSDEGFFSRLWTGGKKVWDGEPAPRTPEPKAPEANAKPEEGVSPRP